VSILMNPFDIRTLLLAKHAQHVVLIHFPVALFITGVALDLLSRGKPDSHLANAAYLNISIAVITLIPAMITGLLAWHFVFHGKRLKGLLLLHALTASSAAVLIITSWMAHWYSRRSRSQSLPQIRIPVEVLGVAIIALTAHLGGFLSGVNS
jgi:uncharacterized membrane protein